MSHTESKAIMGYLRIKELHFPALFSFRDDLQMLPIYSTRIWQTL